jgi:hypothetical protein
MLYLIPRPVRRLPFRHPIAVSSSVEGPPPIEDDDPVPVVVEKPLDSGPESDERYNNCLINPPSNNTYLINPFNFQVLLQASIWTPKLLWAKTTSANSISFLWRIQAKVRKEISPHHPFEHTTSFWQFNLYSASPQINAFDIKNKFISLKRNKDKGSFKMILNTGDSFAHSRRTVEQLRYSRMSCHSPACCHKLRELRNIGQMEVGSTVRDPKLNCL